MQDDTRNTPLVLRPAHVPLAQWRQVYRGARIALDPACLPAVQASAAIGGRVVSRVK